MQNQVDLKVECYSGYRADESPRRFYIGSMRFEIKEITDRWYEAGTAPDLSKADYFRVGTTDGKQYILKHDIDNNRWYLVVKGESITMPG